MTNCVYINTILMRLMAWTCLSKKSGYAMNRENILTMPNSFVPLDDDDLSQMQEFMKNLYDSVNETVYLLETSGSIEKNHPSLIRAKALLMEIEHSSLFPYKPWEFGQKADLSRILESLMTEVEN